MMTFESNSIQVECLNPTAIFYSPLFSSKRVKYVGYFRAICN
jgi:hypothetical protein